VTYDVTVTRDHDVGAWVALIDGLPTGHVGATQVEKFADLGSEVRHLIANLTDTYPDSFTIQWHYNWGDQGFGVMVAETVERWRGVLDQLADM
jgi:hypothetical protein